MKMVDEKLYTHLRLFISYKYSCKHPGVFCIAIIVLAHSLSQQKDISSKHNTYILSFYVKPSIYPERANWQSPARITRSNRDLRLHLGGAD